MAPIGVREAKNRFSALAAQVNETGSPLTVMKNNKPWVVIYPADAEKQARRKKLQKLRALTRNIERFEDCEPVWDAAASDKELLGRERMRRFG